MTNERDIVMQFSRAKQKLADAKDAQAIAQAEFDAVETQLLEHLENTRADATASYEGIGYVRAQKPRLYASCSIEAMPNLIEHLERIGRKDMVRETVNPQTLSAFVSECIDSGAQVPDMVTFYLKPQLRLYNSK